MKLFPKQKMQYIEIVEDEKYFTKKKPVTKNNDKKLNHTFIIILYTIFIISITSFINHKINSSNFEKLFKIKIKLEKLKFFTNTDKALYERVENCLIKDPDVELCIYQFICPKEVINKKRILIGYKGDGSYVMLDDFNNITIAYSIGLSGDIKFDKALADKGIDVFMYDNIINKLPFEHEKFHWKKIGIGAHPDKVHNIHSLTYMMKENGHLIEKNMILKMDMGGSEWNLLNVLSEEILTQFKYILVKYHFSDIKPLLIYNVLKKIYNTHQAFYVHCSSNPNVITFLNNRICETMEVSYVIRGSHNFTKDNSIYPIQEFAYADNKEFNVNILKLFEEYGKI